MPKDKPKTAESGGVEDVRPVAVPQPDATRPVDDWRAAKFPPSKSGRPHPDLYMHAAAAALHGWAPHAHHANQPMKLSEADYDAALKAASSMTLDPGSAQRRPHYRPHAAALSPHHPRSK